MSELLISWIGTKDLDSLEREDAKGKGPIRATLEKYPFRQAILLYNYEEPDRTAQIQRFKDRVAIEAKVQIDIRHAELSSPVHFGDITAVVAALLEELAADQAKPTILLSPGTPAMQSVWILLNKSRYNFPMLVSSPEAGVQEEEVPFDIDAVYRARIGNSADWLSGWTDLPLPTTREFESIVTSDSAVEREKKRAAALATYDRIPALILGETGTGKELFARAIHHASGRKNEPFVAINCGALPESLIDSELFGYKKGAFTDASDDRDGKIMAANGGTLFLDEFGELSLETQVRLLRVLQEGKISPIGSSKEEDVDVRIIAATNRDLPYLIAEGKFREDLYYRVATGVLKLPPLRDRPGDILILAERFLEEINHTFQKYEKNRKARKLSAEAKRVLRQHNWPGNIRELLSALNAACLWSTKAAIDADTMRGAIPQASIRRDIVLQDTIPEGFNLNDLEKKIRDHYVSLAVKAYPGNKAAAGRALGLNPVTMANHIEKLNRKQATDRHKKA